MLHTFYCVQDQLPPFRRVGVVRLVFFLLFFFLDKKETKNQESLIPPHRLHGIAGFQASRAAPEFSFIANYKSISSYYRLQSQPSPPFLIRESAAYLPRNFNSYLYN